MAQSQVPIRVHEDGARRPKGTMRANWIPALAAYSKAAISPRPGRCLGLDSVDDFQYAAVLVRRDGCKMSTDFLAQLDPVSLSAWLRLETRS